MPEFINPIKLWRNSILLFHKFTRITGPFYKLNFDYVVESPILTLKDGIEKRPDIIASGQSGWIVLELTTRAKSKEGQLGSYKSLDPKYLSQYNLYQHKNEPDIIIARLHHVRDGPYCQIIFGEVIEVINLDYLNNESLKRELATVHGLSLKKVPGIPINLVPELKSQHIRQGLVNIVMQIFSPECEGKTLMEIVDEGLDVLHDKVSVHEKNRLRDKVKEQMNLLITKILPDYIEFDGSAYRATEKFRDHPKTKEFVGIELKKWAKFGQVPITEFTEESFDL